MSIKIDQTGSHSDIRDDFPKESAVCIIKPQISLRPGVICPRCKEAKIEYNGMLNLVCPNCGLTEAGAST